MSHLGPLAKTLMGIWAVVWLGLLTVYVSQAANDRIAWHTLRVTYAGPNEYPTVERIGGVPLLGMATEGRNPVAGDPRPVVGDRVLRVGDSDLRGAGTVRFQGLALEETSPDLRVALVFQHSGSLLETRLQADRWLLPWKELPLSLTFGLTGFVLVLRAPRSPSARLLGAYGMVYALYRIPVPGPGPVEIFYAWSTIKVVGMGVGYFFCLAGLLYFPDNRLPTHRAILVWPALLGTLGVVSRAGLYGGALVSPEAGMTVAGATDVAFVTTAIGTLAWKFQRSSPIGRRQLKWAVYGCCLAALFQLAGAAGGLAAPDLLSGPVLPAVHLGVVFAPLGILVAILRFNLFDIDRIISATAAYSLVGFALLAGLIAAVPPAASAISDAVGIGTGTSQLALSLLTAGIAIPVAQRLRPQIERIFFPDRYRMEQGTHELIEALSDCHEPRDLLVLAGERLTDLVRPESCVGYGRRENEFVPLFVRGRPGPPGFDASGALVRALEEHTAPIAMERFVRRGTVPALVPFDRAALETLEAAVVIPIHRRGAGMVGLVCLGPKLSGDVYTSTDLTLLASLADKLSGELQRFEQEDVARQAETLRENLRVYVPGAVQEQLEGGETVAGEREVTVLFVDIRGYTAFAQDREAVEIFAAVNRYTGAVSEIVRKHEGSVVEFNGDGMMAVFGAPRELPGKEHQAVLAGLEIGERMPALGLQTEEGKPLSVGVGIATGQAFVGSVQSADRAIWTALGNTTNLAARLQGLTRDLDAAMVIDAATHAAAGPIASEFQKRERVEIRGRREPEDLFVKPIAA